MRLLFRLFLPLLAVASIVGCRQSDGPVPTPAPDTQGEIRDISRNILNIASGSDPQAPKDLADDLLRYTQDKRPSANDAVMALASQTAEALSGKQVTTEAAEQLAHDYWLAITARELSERQIENLQNEVQSVLQSVGVAEQQATGLAAQIGAVQQVSTDRARRWYEWF